MGIVLKDDTIKLRINEIVSLYSFDTEKCYNPEQFTKPTIGTFGCFKSEDNLPPCMACMAQHRLLNLPIVCTKDRTLEGALESRQHNVVTSKALEAVAKRFSNTHGTDDTQIGCCHALGTSNNSVSGSDNSLGYELFRKANTSNTRSGNVFTWATFFSTGDYYNSWTKVLSGSSETYWSISGTPSGTYYVDDYIRVSPPTGYEYTTITDISGTGVNQWWTVSPALSTIPTIDTQISQVTAECGEFGNLAASWRSGTASFTSGSTTINGENTAWSSGIYSGTKIRLESGTDCRKWYNITNVGSNTAITVNAAPDFTQDSGSYVINGTCFSHTNNMDFVKSTTKTVVLETSWEITTV